MNEKIRSVKKILFICTGNSCRSQMAEGWVRKLKSEILEPFSAGLERHGLDALAVKVMREVGIDISQQQSKLIEDLKSMDFDFVITICKDADTKCPAFPGKGLRLHQAFDNPPALSKDLKTEEDALKIYRRVRDEIKDFVNKMPDNLV